MTFRQAKRPIRSVAIIGGGTSGWMSAAAISKFFGSDIQVELVESEDIGTIGVGEATVPHLSAFNRLLEIDEAEFVSQTQGAFKLGIMFNDWGKIGDSYVHGFGVIGRDLGLMPFHQYWLKALAEGAGKDLGRYSLNTVAAPLGKFMTPPSDAPRNSPLAEIAYAYHFDAALYAVPRERFRRKRPARERRKHRRRPVYRLHRLSRLADRRDAACGLRGLDALAAVRPRLGRAVRQGRPADALYARHRALGGLAVAHSAAAPHRQWLCL
jgi:hypothetical protein